MMQNTDGNTTLFSWSSETRTNTAGPNLPVNVGAVAYDPGNDWLYAQDRSDGYYMHKFQAGTGELLETSQAAAEKCRFLGYGLLPIPGGRCGVERVWDVHLCAGADYG